MNRNDKKVAFVSFNALADAPLADCTDFRLRKEMLDAFRTAQFARIVVLYNKNDDTIDEQDFNAVARSVAMYLVTYLPTTAVSFQVATTRTMERMMPNIIMLEEEAAYFPALLGGKDCWMLIGETMLDQETAENFEIEFVNAQDFLK